MIKKITRRFRKSFKNLPTKIQVPAAILLFTIMGTLSLLLINAASLTRSIEPESGSLTGSATRQSEGGTSGGSAIKFGSGIAGSTLCNANNICVQPGSDLCAALISAGSNKEVIVRGSRSTPYIGDCSLNANSTSALNVTVRADTGHDPLVKGNISLYGRSGWTIDNIDFTNPDGKLYNAFLNFTGGNGWTVRNSEFYGGGGYTQFSVYYDSYYGVPTNWKFENNYLHDNPGDPAHQPTQDHMIYTITSPHTATNGLIANNLLVGSSHGTTLKIGSTSVYDGDGSKGVEVRNNTFVNHDNGNLLIGNQSSANVHDNIFVATSTNPGTYLYAYYRGAMDVTLTDNLFWGNPTDTTQWWNGRDDFLSEFKWLTVTQGLNYTYIDHAFQSRLARIVSTNNIRANPGYPIYNGTSSGCNAYPPFTQGGKTYGARTCPQQN